MGKRVRNPPRISFWKILKAEGSFSRTRSGEGGEGKGGDETTQPVQLKEPKPGGNATWNDETIGPTMVIEPVPENGDWLKSNEMLYDPSARPRAVAPAVSIPANVSNRAVTEMFISLCFHILDAP